MSIDISTHQLAEITCSALGGKVAIDTVLMVWHEIGNVIRLQLGQKKGVKMSSFGTFSLSKAGDPVFVISADLANQFKLKQRAQPAMDNIPVLILNFSQLANASEISRELAEKIYSKFMTCMGRMIFEGRKLLITIHHCAEVLISNGELSCAFIPEFLKLFEKLQGQKVPQLEAVRNIANKTVSNMNTIKRMQQGEAREAREYNENTFQIGRDEGPQRAGKARSASNARGGLVNPITGNRIDNGRRPASAGRTRPGAANNSDSQSRRPGSANSYATVSTNSLMHSPRAHHHQVGGRQAGGGLRKEQLERHTQMHQAAGKSSHNQSAMDPRALAAKALDTGDIIAKVRAKIVERGGSNGIRSIAKLLTIMDNNGDKRLSKDELKYGLRDYGIDLTPTELEQVFFYFDRDRNGFIDATEFLVGLRGELSERRRKFVLMAFNILDTDRSGVISTEEILSKYDLNWHPEVRAGKKTLKEAARDFMAQWERSEADGEVTLQEFEDYYKEVSASIDDDSYFELMIRNAWRIAGGEGAAANTANRRVLVTNKDGSQSVQTIHNELGMNARDMADVRGRLAQQGVDGANVELFGGVDNTDKARRGGGRPAAPQQRGRQLSSHQRPMNSTQQRPMSGTQQRSSTPSRGSGPPREAWGESDLLMQGPRGGDQNLPSEYNGYEQPRRSSSRGGEAQRTSNNNGGGFSAIDTLHRLLYSPPISLEAFCARLQVSSVSSSPRIAMGAFITRLAALDPSLDRNQLKQLWAVVDPKNVGSAEVPSIHALLGERYGKDKTQLRGSNVIERAIKKILERCGELVGLKGLQRSLSIMDDNGDKRLSKDELKYGLQDYGVELNLRELEELFNYFDRDRNGFVDVTEFFIGIKGDLNERRKKLVRLAFNTLDRDRSGVVSTDEMMDVYNFKAHPEVVSGKKTIKEATREFMAQWGDTNSDGEVSYAEFEDYYKGVSASIDGDDYFELMIRNAWRIAGGEGAAANTANRRVLVTNKDGSQSVQTIHNELGMNARDMADVRGRLAQQGVDGANVELFGGVDNTDKARRGGGRPAAPQQGGRQLSSHQRPMNSTQQRPMSGTQRASQGGGVKSLNQTAPGKIGGGAGGNEFERHVAAAKLAAAFRGRLGRKKALHEQRKADANVRAQQEEQEEANRPKPRQITRPKGNSYIGF